MQILIRNIILCLGKLSYIKPKSRRKDEKFWQYAQGEKGVNYIG